MTEHANREEQIWRGWAEYHSGLPTHVAARIDSDGLRLAIADRLEYLKTLEAGLDALKRVLATAPPVPPGLVGASNPRHPTGANRALWENVSERPHPIPD